MKINVKLTEVDYKPLSWAVAFRRKSSQLIRLMTLGLALVLILILPAVLPEGGTALDYLIEIVPMILLICVLVAVNYLPVYLIRRMLKSRQQIHGSHFSGILYELDDQGISWKTPQGSGSLNYDQVHRVVEIRAGYVIYMSPVDYVYIPKRCFSNDLEHRDFVAHLTACLPKKSLKLKAYPFKGYAPDLIRGSVSSDHEGEDGSAEAPNLGKQISQVDIQFTQSDFLKGYFRVYFTGPMGIFTSVAGCVMLLVGFYNYVVLGDASPFWAIFACIFLLFPSLSIWFNVRRLFGKNGALEKPVRYTFYEDGFWIEGVDSSMHLIYSDMVRFRKIPSALILSPTKHHGIIVPKRVFIGKEQELLLLENTIMARLNTPKQTS